MIFKRIEFYQSTNGEYFCNIIDDNNIDTGIVSWFLPSYEIKTAKTWEYDYLEFIIEITNIVISHYEASILDDTLIKENIFLSLMHMSEWFVFKEINYDELINVFPIKYVDCLTKFNQLAVFK